MKYNFDQIIDRSHTDSIKTDKLQLLYGRDDLIPLWVADMDFLSPPAVTEALKQRIEHEIYGYTLASEGYYDSIIRWLGKRHHWTVEKEHISFIPGVVKGFAFAIDAFTQKGDKIIIQPPVYHPFRIVTQSLGRQVVNNPLILENGQYKMDPEGLKKLIAENDCKMLIFCNPHNPGGRVWQPEELKELAEICYENRILVISDEIHSDLTLPGYTHTPFASVSEKAKTNSITLMAPSKTFNIAGIVSSFAVVQNEALRKSYFDYLVARELNQGTIFGYTATEAAYTHGEEWLDQLIDYIQVNVDVVRSFMEEHIPQIKTIVPEASFLVWLDCRELGLSQHDLVKFFADQAHLALNNGAMFGSGGEGFMRLNVGSPRPVIEKALNNLKNAIGQLNPA